MADPATCLALSTVLGILFSSENSFFIQLWKNDTVLFPHIKILRLNFLLVSKEYLTNLNGYCVVLESKSDKEFSYLEY